jgi:hypothetical protein
MKALMLEKNELDSHSLVNHEIADFVLQTSLRRKIQERPTWLRSTL